MKGIPLFGGGFEIETELTIKAVERGYRIVEIPINAGRRQPGSLSKVNLLRDGFIIINTIVALFRDYQPLTFFGLAGLALVFAGLLPALIVIFEPVRIELMPRFAIGLLAVGLVMAGGLLNGHRPHPA